MEVRIGIARDLYARDENLRSATAAPFRLDFTVWALRRREQNRIDTWDGQIYRRALSFSGGACEVSVTQAGSEGRPHLEVVLTGTRLGPAAETAARSTLARLLGLDLDLSDFYARASRDNLLRALVEQYRGVKPPRFPTIFECLLNAVACQQLSLAAGLTVLSRLSATAGAPAGGVHDVPDSGRGPAPTTFDSAQTRLQRAQSGNDPTPRGCGNRRRARAGLIRPTRRRGGSRGARPATGHRALERGLRSITRLGRLHVFPRGDSGALNGLRRFLLGTELEADPEAALQSWAPDAGMVYFHLLLRGLEQRST